MGYLSLSLAGLSVEIRGIVEYKPPRTRVEKPEATRTVTNALVIYGSAYDLPHTWELQACLTRSNWKVLESLWKEHELRRQTSTGLQEPLPSDRDPAILLIDTFQEFIEKSPRTRATAPAPLNTVETVSTDFVSYYPQFLVYFASAPEIVTTGRLSSTGEEAHVVSLSFVESDRKVAP